MKYIWEIKKLERSLPSNVVTVLRWKCTYWENDDATGISTMKKGFLDLNYLDPNDSNFIAYPDLTEDQVIEWIPQELKDTIEGKLSEIMTKRLAPPPPPTKAEGLPW